MSKKEIDIREILKILPHRYPFLLVDKIIELEEGKRAVGIKNVTMNEAHFSGHFPDYPIMPGVLIVEAMAQVAAVLGLKLPENEGKLVYFAGLDQVRFRKTVVPGDQIRIEVEVLKVRGSIGKMKVQAKVEGELVAEGELMYSLVDKDAEAKGGARVHPTAVVHSSAELGENVTVGPYAIIGEGVRIGDGTVVDAHALVSRATFIGKNCYIHTHASLGDFPQDTRFKGEKSFIRIGDRNIIREFVTIHLATGEGAETVIGDDNILMVHSHVPHNAKLGSQIVLGGYVGLGGHVTIEDQAVIGGLAGIHQYVRVGKLSMIGGHAKVVQDIPPFMLVDGIPAQVRGVNSVGLSRRGVSLEAQNEIKKAFRILYRSSLSLSQSLEKIRRDLKVSLEEIRHLLSFLGQESERGITKKLEEIEEREAEEMILPEIPELGI